MPAGFSSTGRERERESREEGKRGKVGHADPLLWYAHLQVADKHLLRGDSRLRPTTPPHPPLSPAHAPDRRKQTLKKKGGGGEGRGGGGGGGWGGGGGGSRRGGGERGVCGVGDGGIVAVVMLAGIKVVAVLALGVVEAVAAEAIRLMNV